MYKRMKRAETLLERMGFGDLDIHTKEHDVGLVHYSKEEAARDVVRRYIMKSHQVLERSICLHQDGFMLVGEKGIEFATKMDGLENILMVCKKDESCCLSVREYLDPDYFELEVVVKSVSLEHPLVLDGRYMGFVDILFDGWYDILHPCLDDVTVYCPTSSGWGWDFVGFIEVKSSYRSLSELLRELKFYRSVLSAKQQGKVRIIAAVGFTRPVDEATKEVLEREGFIVLALDEGKADQGASGLSRFAKKNG